MKKIVYILFLLFSGLLQAGAVLHIDRIDLINGQKIIFLAEQHIGEITKKLDAKDVCLKQYRPLSTLFDQFKANKRDYILFIEFHKTLREYNRALHSEFGFPLSALSGCEPSYLDRFYTQNIYGQPTPQIGIVDNFDQRTKDDWWLLNAEDIFSQYMDRYEESGFNDAKLNEFRKRFFGSSLYRNLNPNMQAYVQDFEKRLTALRNKIQAKVLAADIKRIYNLVNWRTRNFAAFINLVNKATFVNKSIFEFLFDIAQTSKNNFYELLHQTIEGQAEPITSTLELVDFIYVIAELSLLDEILSAQRKNIIVSCGAEHAEQIIKFFFKDNPRVRRIDSLDMLTDQMRNVDYATQRVLQFVLGE